MTRQDLINNIKKLEVGVMATEKDYHRSFLSFKGQHAIIDTKLTVIPLDALKTKHLRTFSNILVRLHKLAGKTD